MIIYKYWVQDSFGLFVDNELASRSEEGLVERRDPRYPVLRSLFDLMGLSFGECLVLEDADFHEMMANVDMSQVVTVEEDQSEPQANFWDDFGGCLTGRG